jgi:uncharacterized membrane protein YccC
MEILKAAKRNIPRYLDLSRQPTWDAFQLALQSAVAAVATFVLMRSFGLPEVYVAIISAVFVIQPSVGNTLVAAGDRLVATLVGSAVGVVCMLLLPHGWGTAVALATTMLVINAIAGFRPDWRYGVVAGVALALGAEQNAIDTAQDRALALALGALIGVMVSLVIVPDTAKARASRYLSSSLSSLAAAIGLFLDEHENNQTPSKQRELERDIKSGLNSAQGAAGGIQIADRQPIDDRITQTELLYASWSTLHRAVVAAGQAGASETDAVADDLERILTKIKRAIQGLAEDGRVDSERLKDISDDVETAYSAETDRRTSMFDSVIVFALRETTLALQNLNEAFNEHYQGSVLDWGAEAHSKVQTRAGGVFKTLFDEK